MASAFCFLPICFLPTAFCLRFCLPDSLAINSAAQGQWAVVPNPSGFQGYESSRQRGAALEIVSGKYHSFPLRRKFTHQALQGTYRGGVEACEGFIQQQKLRFMKERASERDALLQSSGEFPNRGARPVAQIEKLQRGIDLLFQPGRANSVPKNFRFSRTVRSP